MKVQFIIITDSKIIDRICACNVKSRILYVTMKLIIEVCQQKSTQLEIRVVPQSSGLYVGRGGPDYSGIRSTNGKPRVIGNIKVINYCYGRII